MAKLDLKNIDKSYGTTQVIKDLNLSIEKDEFIVLVGPSGCGKSTILRMIAGLEEISGGELLINGDNHTHSEAKDRGVAMVFQDYALYPHMTVYKNMSFGLEVKGLDETEIKNRIEKAANILDLGAYLQRKPAELSGGQRQRVAMGRAIVKNSTLFLYDEPLSNLDAKLRSKMRGEIKRFHQNNKATAIYVTHDQMEAMTLADRLVILNQGNIEQVGTPLEVFENPKSQFVADFIGNPGMNFFNVDVLQKNDRLMIIHEKEAFSFPVPDSKKEFVHEGQKLIMGIRPSDIFIPEDHEVSDWNTFGKVDFVEFLGKNAFLNLNVGDDECIGEIVGNKAPKTGEDVPLRFNLNYIHFFDKESKVNLNYLN